MCKRCGYEIAIHMDVNGKCVDAEKSVAKTCAKCGHVIGFVPIERDDECFIPENVQDLDIYA